MYSFIDDSLFINLLEDELYLQKTTSIRILYCTENNYF